MRKQRSCCIEFKRQVVEEYLSGAATAAQICRKHSISSDLLYHWRRQYLKNSFEADSAREAAQEERIRQLEQHLEKPIWRLSF
ncbi:MAG TPA: transposase [Nitrospirota bacterium]|nr:transposase [Nitrospirota bacterium]